MGFPRQEYWSGLPFSSPGDLPDPGIETGYPALQGDSLPTEPPGKPPGCLGYLDIGYLVQVPKSELYTSGSLLV